jgi:UDP-2,4-diacetamido-2,4,6-trideoxy-beta-L-altropyranose hydrolase
MRNLVIRADAGAGIGSGHVMRCLGLAEIFAGQGWQVSFAATSETFDSVAALSNVALERLVLTGSREDEPAALARRWPTGADILLVDHYWRDATFERGCRPWTRKIVVLDDLADRPHQADLLVDGVNAAEDYRKLVPPACLLLCGPRNAIVSQRFPAVRDAALARRDGRPVERILVTFGQFDALNMTIRVLAALGEVAFEGNVDVALGAAAPHLQQVRAAATGRVRLHVNASNLESLMISADLAIGAGGVTAWERCCLGLPSIVTAIADNQRVQIAKILKASAGLGAGEPDAGVEARIVGALQRLMGDADMRVRMARSAADLVDGHGSTRLVEAAARILS